MATVLQLQDGDDWFLRQRTTGVTTGFRHLDTLTTGFLPGSLWLLVGTPGVGRTVMACQFALAAALAQGAPVRYFSTRDSADSVLTNMLCSHARASSQAIHAGTTSADEDGRLREAMRALSESSVHIQGPRWLTGDGQATKVAASVDDLLGPMPTRTVLFIDDADDLFKESIPEALPRLRVWTRRTNCTLVLSIPEEQVLIGEQLDPTVRREADVVLRLGRPDQFDRTSRPGEADLRVLRHRAGPTDELRLAFQGHCRRFLEID